MQILLIGLSASTRLTIYRLRMMSNDGAQRMVAILSVVSSSRVMSQSMMTNLPILAGLSMNGTRARWVDMGRVVQVNSTVNASGHPRTA
jgi:hypothetical protein